MFAPASCSALCAVVAWLVFSLFRQYSAPVAIVHMRIAPRLSSLLCLFVQFDQKIAVDVKAVHADLSRNGAVTHVTHRSLLSEHAPQTNRVCSQLI